MLLVLFIHSVGAEYYKILSEYQEIREGSNPSPALVRVDLNVRRCLCTLNCA